MIVDELIEESNGVARKSADGRQVKNYSAVVHSLKHFNPGRRVLARTHPLVNRIVAHQVLKVRFYRIKRNLILLNSLQGGPLLLLPYHDHSGRRGTGLSRISQQMAPLLLVFWGPLRRLALDQVVRFDPIQDSHSRQKFIAVLIVKPVEGREQGAGSEHLRS